MTLRTGTFKIQQVSRTGRLRLFGNAWLTPSDGYNPDDLEVTAGRVYRFTLDDTTCKVITIRAMRSDGLSDRDYLNGLQADEINRMEAVLSAYRGFVDRLSVDDRAEFEIHLCEEAGRGRIDPESLNGEICRVSQQEFEKQGKREYLAQSENAGLVAIAVQRDSYIGADGRRYISASKTESFDRVSGNADSDLGVTCHDGI